MNFLTKAWYSKNPLLYSLVPFSLLYCLGAKLKKFCYSAGWKKISHFPVPIIVVGNITVGGTGKTPLIIALAQFFSAQGFKPGIVSRGYGGRANKTPFLVMADSDPIESGDEPLLIKRATGCPMVIARSRVAAVQRLLQSAACDLVLSDDGLQHYALGRSIEIAVVDGERYFGNGLCLPAGPLREPITRLQSVDWLVVQGQKNGLAAVDMQLVPGKIYNLHNPELHWNVSRLTQPIHAVAGIGNPQRFFRQLRSLGLELVEHAFPDHHRYRPQDFNFPEDAVIIMTEKDAVKCAHFIDHRYWCLPVTAQCGSGFFQKLLSQVQVLATKLSS